MKNFKLKFLLLFFALAAALPPAWAGEYTLTQSVLELTGSYTTNTEKTVDGITYVYSNLMKNNDNIQAKASSGTIENTTAFPGDITSVKITHNGTARPTTISGRADGSDWEVIKTGDGSITGDFKGKGYKYFKITRGDNAAYWTQIVITCDDDLDGKVATPTFSPAAGDYYEPQNVAITCSTEDASIYYTTNSDDPTTESTKYTDGTITVSETTTLKAIAVKDGMVNSAIASATYSILRPLATEFVLVTDINQLEAGKQIIIADKNSNTSTSVLSTNQRENNRGVANYTISDLTINDINKTAEIFTLEKEDNYWYLKANRTKGYIFAPGGGNYLRTQDEKSSSAQATITIAEAGHSIVFNISATQKNLRYNSSSNLFSCYNTGQKTIFIYVEKSSDTTEPVDAGLSFGETTEYTVEAGSEFTAPTLINPNNVSPITYTSSNEDVATFVDGTLVIGDAGTTTITASFAGNDTYLAGSASYTITVTRKAAGLKYETAEYTVYNGNTFTTPTLTNPNNLTVTYSSNNEEVAMVDEDGEVVLMGGLGDATITAKSEQTGTYEAGNASYIIHVIAKKTATLTFNTASVTLYDDEEFTAPALTTDPEGLAITYSSSKPEVATVNENGNVTIVAAGTTTITATFAGNDEYSNATASYTITVEPRPEIIADPESLTMNTKVGKTTTATFDVLATDLKGDVTLTLSDENNVYSINPTSITKAEAEDGVTVTVTYAPSAEGNNNATITLASTDAENVVITLTGTAVVPEVVATPTFSLVPGSYGEAKTLTISCATEGATISYSTDGGNSWTQSTTLELTDDVTVIAKAEVDGMNASTATAEYIIDIIAELPDVEPIDGYFSVKNNGNGFYANIQGRKTLTFTDAKDAKAGTVVRLVTNNKGQVQMLRSQAADLQDYANRAMRYVPTFVELVVNKLGAEGAGNILGENGLDEIMEKFKESFDHHLYVEQAEQGYRIYGQTPNMQHVVDFYREHQHQVETKLPMLEGFINDAIDKVLEKTNGRGSSILVDFELHKVWENMGRTLPEPVVGDTTAVMNFYRAVLNNKNYVWSFAYEAAMIYWTNVKKHPRYEELKGQLGEFADYLDKIEQIRPEAKYYIVQKDNKPDYISDGNVDIINNEARTFWTLEPRTEFTVNIPEANVKPCWQEYFTTLYTDFAYDLPEGVTAYKVTGITNSGSATLAALTDTIPAQTPVLLKAETAGDKVLTIIKENGTAPDGNLLVGGDYFIKKFEIKTPQVESVFNLALDLLGETFYNTYIKEYEYLMLKTSGTANNKYFWGLSNSDLEQCVAPNALQEEDCVVRSLSVNDGVLGFHSNWSAPVNEAFLESATFSTINLQLKGDANHDGAVNILDVTDIIDYLLATLSPDQFVCTYCADVNNDNKVDISDVTEIIDILLANPED